jgi:gas vesicle protein
MKFAAVVLLACVAVSSAAFTGTLVQRTQPAVKKAMFQLQLATGGQKFLPQVEQAVQQIVQHVQNSLQQLMQQAQQLVAQGQVLSQQFVQQLQATAAVLQNIAGQAGQQAQQAIQQLLANVAAIVQGNKGFNLQQVVAHVQATIQEAITAAQALVEQIDLHQLLINAINAVLPQNVAQFVIAHLNLAQRGIISDLWNNVWGQVSQTAQQLAQQIGNIVQQVQQVGQAAFQEVQQQAAQFLQDVSQGVSHLTSEAASLILSQVHQLQGVLGDQYQQVVAALQQIVASNIN